MAPRAKRKRVAAPVPTSRAQQARIAKAYRRAAQLEAALTPPTRSALESAMSQTIAREWAMPAVPRRAVRQLADAWEEQWREREGRRAPELRPRPRKPPKAITVLDVAKEFGQAKPAVDFAKAAGIPPSEWADDLADEFDVDVHAIYDNYYGYEPSAAA